MQTHQIEQTVESDLWISFKKESPQILTDAFFKEMKTLLKLIGINGELITQSRQESHTDIPGFSMNVSRDVEKAQNMLQQFKALHDTSDKSEDLYTQIDPEMVLREVADICSVHVNVVTQKRTTHWIKSDHELLVDTLVTLIGEATASGNSLFGACIYDMDNSVCLTLNFSRELIEGLEATVAMHYSLNLLRTLGADYDRQSDTISIKFKKPDHEK